MLLPVFKEIKYICGDDTECHSTFNDKEMKKLTLLLLSLLMACTLFQACDDTKSYAEMLEDEDNAIAAFIRDSSITVISQSEFYEQDSTTNLERNEYVQLASGVYMQIVDKGSEALGDTVRNNEEIMVRFSEYDLLNKGYSYSNLDNVGVVDVFKYTVTSTSIAGKFTEGNYMTYLQNTTVPPGWLIPLEYIRDRAHVRLIVPSNMGNNTAMASVVPYYYDIQKYQFYR